MAVVVVQVTDCLDVCTVFASGASAEDQFVEMERMRIENAPKGPDPAQWSPQARAARGAQSQPQPQPLVIFVHEEQPQGSGLPSLFLMFIICATVVFWVYAAVRLAMMAFG